MSVEVSARLAQRWIDEFNERVPVGDIYTDGAIVWNNITQDSHPVTKGQPSGKLLTDALPDLRFEDAVVHAWDDGFAVQYTVRATLLDGSQLRAPAVGIGRVTDGAISSFKEYVDSGQCAGLAAAAAQATADVG